MEKIKKTDEQIREMAQKEVWNMPDSCSAYIEQVFTGLPDKIEGKSQRGFKKKRILILAAALTAVLGTTALASEMFQWNNKAVENFHHPTKEEQDTMTMEGIAREQTVSTADAGITITARQTVQDQNSLYILLDIQAEDKIIDGNGGFDNPDENGEYGHPWIFTEEGDAFTNVSMSFTPDTPVFSELSNHGYYEIFAIKDPDREWNEDTVTVNFTEYNYDTYENGNSIPHKIEGSWELTLSLGEDTKLDTDVYELNRKVDISGVSLTVKRVELSPLSLILVFDLDDMKQIRETFYADQQDVVIYETQFTGFLDRNGEEIDCGWSGMSGKHDLEKGEDIVQLSLNQFVEVDEISAVLLGEEKVPVPLKN